MKTISKTTSSLLDFLIEDIVLFPFPKCFLEAQYEVYVIWCFLYQGLKTLMFDLCTISFLCLGGLMNPFFNAAFSSCVMDAIYLYFLT
jgi:hypothetical protein